VYALPSGVLNNITQIYDYDLNARPTDSTANSLDNADTVDICQTSESTVVAHANGPYTGVVYSPVFFTCSYQYFEGFQMIGAAQILSDLSSSDDQDTSGASDQRDYLGSGQSEMITSNPNDEPSEHSLSVVYHWDFGDGENTETISSEVTHVYRHPRCYTVSVEVIVGEVSDDDTTTVIISPASPREVSITDLYDGTIYLTWSKVEDAAYYVIYRNGEEHAFSVNTFYYDRGLVIGRYYRYKIVSVYNDIRSTPSDEVTCTPTLLNTPPVARILTDSTCVWAGDPVSFVGVSVDHDEGDSVMRCHWYFSDGEEAEGDRVTHVFTRCGVYTVTFEATDKYGGTGSDQIKITVVTVTPPVAVISTGSFTGLVGEEILFDGSKSYASSPDKTIISYSWDFGDGSTGVGDVVTHRYSRAGSYQVVLTVIDSSNNIGTDMKLVVIKNNSAPSKPEISMVKSKDSEYSYTFTVVSFDPDDDMIRYVFDYGYSSSATFYTPFFPSGVTVNSVHTWFSPGVYNVVVYAEDAKGARSEMTELSIEIKDSMLSSLQDYRIEKNDLLAQDFYPPFLSMLIVFSVMLFLLVASMLYVKKRCKNSLSLSKKHE